MYAPFLHSRSRPEQAIKVMPRQNADQYVTRVNPLDVQLAVEIGNILAREYPGYLWFVQADHLTGIATFKSTRIKINMGMTMHMDRLKDGWDMGRVKTFAGEYLERFNLPRGRAPDVIDPEIQPQAKKR